MKQRAGRAAFTGVAVLCAAVLGGLVGGVGGGYATRFLFPQGERGPAVTAVRPFTEVVERGTPAAAGETVVQVVKNAGPAVVNIDTLARARDPLADFLGLGPQVRQGQGSGFIINGREGYVVTNNHVVAGAERIRVTLANGRVFPATVVGLDPIGDIGLIRLQNASDLPELKFGDSDQLAIGQIVVAIGNPLGFENSVTAGVLSQVGRELEGQRGNIPLSDLLQTDAAINPGNSGGPLLNSGGDVIGMNTAIVNGAQGIGFAVASNTIKRTVQSLLEKGRVVRPWVGLYMAWMNAAAAKELGIPGDREGIGVGGTAPGGPAERAGLQRGDLILEANGTPLKSIGEFRKLVRAMEPGQELTLKGYRGANEMTWKVTVGELPQPDPRVGG